jgi:hypothetical protein
MTAVGRYSLEKKEVVILNAKPRKFLEMETVIWDCSRK